MLLNDKVLIITGVGPGMGRKLAVIGAAEGAKVALAARSRDYVAQVTEEVRAAGGDAIGVPTDVDNAEQCETLAKATLDKWGRIDGLVNSAYMHGAFASFADSSIEDWQATMSVTCFGALRMVKAVLPAMKSRHEGAIVNVSSMGSVQPYAGGAGYATAKAALEGATRQLAKELGAFNIRVNATRMGRMDGVPWHNARSYMAQQSGQTEDEIDAPFRKLISLGQLPPDEDCAKSVLFFVSDYSRVISGTSIDINGGEYMAS
jgi:NAD(P)-dependent dehydrogenase (short-subunit alcohol dehydrogenase family)